MVKRLKKTAMEFGWSYVGREWGMYLKRNIQYPKAEHYFRKSLQANPKQTRTLLESSQCKLREGKMNDALIDIMKCIEIEPNDVKTRHQYAKCLFDLNEMESAFNVAHKLTVKQPTNNGVRHTKDAIEMSLRNGFCSSAQPILRKYKKHLQHTSIKSTGEKLPPTQIMAERENAIELMKHKLYFDSTFAEQLDFWQCVQLDETFDDDIQKLIKRIIGNLYAHENILYTREPIYARRNRFDLSSLSKSRTTTSYLKCIDTQRDALHQLQQIQNLATTDFMAALSFAERVLSEFYAGKRTTNFPTKFQFICKILHFIGSEYLKLYRKYPCNLMSLDDKKRLTAMFNVWGKMIQDEDQCDEKINYFTNRLHDAEYAIEKAYILHQMSEISFRFRRPEESMRYANDLVAMAKECNSKIWTFLGYYNVIRVDAIKRDYHSMKSNLLTMKSIAENLDSFCQLFVNVAIRSYEDIRREKPKKDAK